MSAQLKEVINTTIIVLLLWAQTIFHIIIFTPLYPGLLMLSIICTGLCAPYTVIVFKEEFKKWKLNRLKN